MRAAVKYVRELKPEGKTKATEYVCCAPDFVQTPLRETLQRNRGSLWRRLFAKVSKFDSLDIIGIDNPPYNGGCPMNLITHRQFPPDTYDAAIARASGQRLSRRWTVEGF